jgi:hypothetical protein
MMFWMTRRCFWEVFGERYRRSFFRERGRSRTGSVPHNVTFRAGGTETLLQSTPANICAKALLCIREEAADSFNKSEKSLYRGHPTARVILYRALPSQSLKVSKSHSHPSLIVSQSPPSQSLRISHSPFACFAIRVRGARMRLSDRRERADRSAQRCKPGGRVRWAEHESTICSCRSLQADRVGRREPISRLKIRAFPSAIISVPFVYPVRCTATSPGR